MGARVGSELEARAAAAISTALTERAALDGLAPLPEALARTLAGIRVRVWSGPVEDRVRIADPRRVRAARFDNVFVASLQDGEFPRGDRPHRPVPHRAPARVARPAAAPRQRRRGALPLPRLPGAAETQALPLLPRQRRERRRRSALALLEDVRQLLEPIEGETSRPRPGRGRPPRRRRAVGDRAGAGGRRTGRRADPEQLLEVAGAEAAIADRVLDRLANARSVEAATRAPGPLSNPAVIAALSDVHAYGGTTLEGFDVCSYRWFVSARALPAAARPDSRPARPGRHRARCPLRPLQGAARGRSPAPPRFPGRLDRPRPGAGRRDRGGERTRRAPGRAGHARSHRGPARALPRRGGAPRDRRLRALAAGGGVLRVRGGRATDARDRRLAPARSDRPSRPSGRRARPRPRLQALEQSLAAGEVRGGGEAAAAALPDRRRRALGSGDRRRPLPPAARHLGAPAARARRWRTPRPTSPATGSPRPTASSGRNSTSCSPMPAVAPARSSPGCELVRSIATPARARDCATTASARPSATSRRSAAATGRRSSRSATRRTTSGEPAQANRRAARPRSRRRPPRSWSRPAPAPARPG